MKAAAGCAASLDNLIGGMLGEEGKKYIPYLSSVLIYIGILSLAIYGLVGTVD